MKPWDDFSRKELIELVEQLTEQSKTEEAQLAAAEKRASEAEAFIALTSDLTEDFHTPPAAAQAVAEVLEAVRKWHETESPACELFTAIDEYFAKLDAARKGGE